MQFTDEYTLTHGGIADSWYAAKDGFVFCVDYGCNGYGMCVGPQDMGEGPRSTAWEYIPLNWCAVLPLMGRVYCE